ncbi:D-lactate dehydrogenase [Pseudoalteromonas sp. MTN2-4]
MQAANTGLTEGSTPSSDGYDRDIVIFNTLAMNDLVVLEQGKQVLSFPGTTLHKLEKTLKLLARAPHSVIGSSCLGASIVGGVANNSGGALVKRGPAYTELSLFARVDEKGQLHLVNHLGIGLGDTPEEILKNLMSGNFAHNNLVTNKSASATDYEGLLRDVDADTPSRFNADTSKLYEASGCAGKIAVFAVRLDTFEVPNQEQTFYIGTNEPKTLSDLRRHILSEFQNLPEVGEYLHREIFDIAEKYGKDTFLSIQHLGTDRLPKLFALKGRLDATFKKWRFMPSNFTDKVMQLASYLFPQHLPKRMLEFRDNYEHHLILKMSDGGIAEAKQFLQSYFTQNPQTGGYFECTTDEASKAYLQRFAAAGAAIRYQALHEDKVGDILALDIALRRNDFDWVEQLPEDIASQVDKRLYYGHFFCHVFHQDYVLKKGADAKKVKAKMLALLDSRGAKYPAEHNVGHLYEAEEDVKAFYRSLDPTNRFNPGVGKMEKHKRNCSCC